MKKMILPKSLIRLSGKNTTFMIHVFEQSSDDDRRLQKAQDLVNFESLRLPYEKFLIPTV